MNVLKLIIFAAYLFKSAASNNTPVFCENDQGGCVNFSNSILSFIVENDPNGLNWTHIEVVFTKRDAAEPSQTDSGNSSSAKSDEIELEEQNLHRVSDVLESRLCLSAEQYNKKIANFHKENQKFVLLNIKKI